MRLTTIFAIGTALLLLNGCSSVFISTYSVGDNFDAHFQTKELTTFGFFEVQEFSEVVDQSRILYQRRRADLEMANEDPGGANFNEETTQFAVLVDRRSGNVVEVLNRKGLEAALNQITEVREARVVAEKQREERARNERAAAAQAKRDREAAERQEREAAARLAREKKRLQLEEAKAKIARYEIARMDNIKNKDIINAIRFAISGDDAKFLNSSTPLADQNYAFSDCVYTEWGDDYRIVQWDFNKINWATEDFDVDTSVMENPLWRGDYITSTSATFRYGCEGNCRLEPNFLAALFGGSLEAPPITPSSTMSFDAVQGNPQRTRKALRDIKAKCPGYQTPY